ncbi:hypothetical protein BT69DRAFT_1275939, partial [Atractiella rhizophila]
MSYSTRYPGYIPQSYASHDLSHDTSSHGYDSAYGYDYPMGHEDFSSPDSFSSGYSTYSTSPHSAFFNQSQIPQYTYGGSEEGYGVGFGAPVDLSSQSTSATSPSGSSSRGRRGGRGHSISSSASSRGGIPGSTSPALYLPPSTSSTSGISVGSNPNSHLLEEPIYPPTALPPQPYGTGPSPFAVPHHQPKIYGSQMDRLPEIEDRMAEIERMTQEILRQRAQETLNNVTLEEEIEAELRRQELEEAEIRRVLALRGHARGGSYSRGRGTGRGL